MGRSRLSTKKSPRPDADSLFRALVATAVDGIIVIGADGSVQVYNTACEKLFGFSPDEVIGKNITVLMPASYFAEHVGNSSYRGETGDRGAIDAGRDVIGRRKDQTTFPMHLSIGEGDLGGQPIFVGIIHDLTDRKKAEDVLREREARLHSILETLPDAIVTIDELGVIESFSAAATRLFGYDPGEVVGRNLKILMPSPYGEQHDRLLEHDLSTGERHTSGSGRIVVGLKCDGRMFPMEIAIGEVRGGEKRLFTGFVRDLTERQGTGQRMQELQSELLHVSRLSAMGQMASALAHELNQPLTAIMNYVKAVKRTLGGIEGYPTARVNELIDGAAQETLRASAIIRNLRDFVEKRESKRALGSLNKVVEESVALGFVGAADNNVKVRLDLDSQLPPILIDRIQIQQVLINLIRNSVEAMQSVDQRELAISSSRVEDGFVQITVSDTGPGLPPEVSGRLFQPFITTKETGMGIGLTICRSIVEAHGGRIWPVEEQSLGAGFSFRLPLADGSDIA